jgi:hypothetical protein
MARRSAETRAAPIGLALTALLTIVSLLPPGRTAAAGGAAALILTAIAWDRAGIGARLTSQVSTKETERTAQPEQIGGAREDRISVRGSSTAR